MIAGGLFISATLSEGVINELHVGLSAEYPVAFTSLLNKVLPMQIGGGTDEGDGINIEIHFTEPPKVIEHQPRFVDPDR